MNGWEEADCVSVCVGARVSSSALSSVFMCKRKPALALRRPHRCLFVVTARFVLSVFLFITLGWLYGCGQIPRRGHNHCHDRYAWVSNTALWIYRHNLSAWISSPCWKNEYKQKKGSRACPEYGLLICSFLQCIINEGCTERFEVNLKRPPTFPETACIGKLIWKTNK